MGPIVTTMFITGVLIRHFKRGYIKIGFSRKSKKVWVDKTLVKASVKTYAHESHWLGGMVRCGWWWWGDNIVQYNDKQSPSITTPQIP